MGISYNKCLLVGNVTRDPELRYTPSGAAVTEVGLAINEQYKDAQGKVVDKCVFVDVTLWKRTAEVACQFLTKGAPVLIEGKLELDSWQDKEGQKRTKLKVVGERMQLLGGGKGEGGQSRGQSGGRQQQQSQHDDFGGGDDDAPF